MKKIILAALATIASLTVNAQYAVGDIMEKDGVTALVIYVDETGNHGFIMSLPKRKTKDEIKEAKAEKKSIDKKELKRKAEIQQECLREIYAKLGNNGKHNAAIMEAYCLQKGLALEDIFPKLAWARSLGNDWYIPGSQELEYYSYVLGNGLGKEHGFSGIKGIKESFSKWTELNKQINTEYERYVPMYVWSSCYSKLDNGTIYPCCFGMLSASGLKPMHWFTMIKNHKETNKTNALSTFTCAVCEF